MREMWEEIKNPNLKATLRWYFPRSLIGLVTAPMFLALIYVGVVSLWSLLRGMVAMVTAEEFFRKALLPFLMIGPAAVSICLLGLPVIWKRWRAPQLSRVVVIAALFVMTIIFVQWWRGFELEVLEFLNALWGNPLD